MEQKDNEDSFSEEESFLEPPSQSFLNDTETDRQKLRERQQKNRADLPKKYGVEVKQPANVKKKSKKSSKKLDSSESDESLRGPSESMLNDSETDRQKARETQQKNRADLPKKYGVEVKQPAVVTRKNKKSSEKLDSSESDESLRGPSQSMLNDSDTERQKLRERQQKNRADLPKKYGVEVKQPAVVKRKNKKSTKKPDSSESDESLRGPSESMLNDSETDRQNARVTQQKNRAELAKKYAVEVKQPAVAKKTKNRSAATRRKSLLKDQNTKLTNKATSELKSHIQSVVSSPDTPEVVTFQKPARKRTSLATCYRPQNSLSTQSNAYDMYGTVLSQHYNDNDTQSQKILALGNAETTNITAVNKDTVEDSSGSESSSASEDEDLEIANSTDQSLLEPSKRNSKTPLNTERFTENSSPASMLSPPSRKREELASSKKMLLSVGGKQQFVTSTPFEIPKTTLSTFNPEVTPVSSQGSGNQKNLTFTPRKSLRFEDNVNPIGLPNSSHENSSNIDDAESNEQTAMDEETTNVRNKSRGDSTGRNTKKNDEASVKSQLQEKSPNKEDGDPLFQPPPRSYGNNTLKKRVSLSVPRTIEKGPKRPSKRSVTFTRSSSSLLDDENNKSDENNSSDNNSSVSLDNTGGSWNWKKRSRHPSPTKPRKSSTKNPLQNKTTEIISKVMDKSKSHVVSSPAAVVDNSEVVTAISESEVDNIETTNDTDRSDSNKPSPPAKKNAKKTANTKKTKKRRLSSWYPDCPLMKKYGGEVLYNQDILTEDVLKDVVNECGLQYEIPKEKVPALLGSMNTFLEKTFDRLSDETPKSMYYGVFTFQAMLKTMKEEKLVHEDCDEKRLIEMMKKDFSEEDFKAAQGLLYPKPNSSDTLDFFNL